MIHAICHHGTFHARYEFFGTLYVHVANDTIMRGTDLYISLKATFLSARVIQHSGSFLSGIGRSSMGLLLSMAAALTVRSLAWHASRRTYITHAHLDHSRTYITKRLHSRTYITKKTSLTHLHNKKDITHALT